MRSRNPKNRLTWKQKQTDKNVNKFGRKWYYILCDNPRERDFKEPEVTFISRRSQKTGMN
jgi:hypothetical protein